MGPLFLEHHHYTYDYRNQLIEVSLEAGVGVISVITNTYDPLARRVVEEIDLDGDQITDGIKQMVYGGVSLWEVIEQIDLLNNDEVLSTHVFGLGIDDEVHYQRPNATADQNIWSHRDDLNSLTSITDGTGIVLERYEYGDYGKLKVLDVSGVAQSTPQYDAGHMYTGRLMLPGTDFYDYRYRVQDSVNGRFVQRDPLGYIDSMNYYAYVASSPWVYNDPTGEAIPLLVGGVVISVTALELAAAATGVSVAGCIVTPGCVAEARRIAGQTISTTVSKIEAHYIKKELAKQAARSLAAQVGKCKGLWEAYDALDCPACKGSDSAEVLAAKKACFVAEIALRSAYIASGCDLVLKGSFNRGIKQSEKGHQEQLDNKFEALANCNKLTGACSGD